MICMMKHNRLALAILIGYADHGDLCANTEIGPQLILSAGEWLVAMTQPICDN